MADSRIPMMVQPPNIDLGASYGKALTLRQMLNQQEDYRRARQDDIFQRDVLSRYGDDLEGASSALLKGGLSGPALKLRKEHRDTEKSRYQNEQEKAKVAAQFASGILSAPAEQRAYLYEAGVRRYRSILPPGVEEKYSPEVEKSLGYFLRAVLNPEEAANRADLADPPLMQKRAGAPPQAATMEQFTAPLVSPDQHQPVPRGTELDGGGLPIEPETQRYASEDIQGTPLPGLGAPQSIQEMFAAPQVQQTAPQPQTMNDLLTQAPQEEIPAQEQLPQPIEMDVVDKAPARSTAAMEREALAWERKGTPGGLFMAKMLRDEVERREKMALDEDKFAYQKTKDEADREAQHGKTSQTNINKQREIVLRLSDDFRQEPAVKSYRTVQPMIASMENAVKRDTAASDLDIVYAIAKIFDPESVVREGEQLLVIRSGGLPSSVQSALGWVVGGQRLSSDLRSGLLDQAKSRADNYRQAYESVVGSYAQQADRWDVDVRDIVREHRVESSASRDERSAQQQRDSLKSKGIGSGTEQDPYKIKGDEGYEQLPSGSYFMGPDGVRRVKP